jgi:hypothetical protein
VIDLLWTGIGGLTGAELGMVTAWAIDRRRERRAWVRHYSIGVGALLGAGLGAAVSLPGALGSELEAAGPALKAVHDRFPAAFAAMSAAGSMDHKDQAALQNSVRPLMVSLIQAHRREMDDDSATAVGQLMLDETEPMAVAQPEACVAILDGRPAGLDLRTLASPEMRRRDAEVTGRLVQQLAAHPATPPTRLSDEEALRLSDLALARLTSGERDTVTPILLEKRRPSTAREAGAYCAFQRARLGAALDGQPGTVRRLLAG